MDVKPKLPEFNEEVAQRYLNPPAPLTGLPAFLGIRFVHVEPGLIRAEVPVAPNLLTRFGNMHGGVVAAICDHVLGSVCYPHMRPGQWAATTEFKLNLVAPVSKGTITAEARIINMTRTTAVVRMDLVNEDRLCCAAQGTVLIMEPRPK